MGMDIFDMINSEFGGAARVLVSVCLIYILCTSLFNIVIYVLEALGLYNIAKRRGIHHAWLSWIPIGNGWILGSIGDQYQYVAKGKVKNRRKTLLCLMIIMYVLLFVVLALMIWLLVALIQSEMDYYYDEMQLLAPAIVTMIVNLVLSVISITALIVMYFAYYDIFASCSPNNAVLFLVLGIFFPFLLAIFVFAVRKKDLGMPPRRAQIPVAPWTPAPPPPVPAWQQPAEPVAEPEIAATEPEEIVPEEKTEE